MHGNIFTHTHTHTYIYLHSHTFGLILLGKVKKPLPHITMVGWLVFMAYQPL